MPDLPSNSPGFEPDGPELPDFLNGSEGGDFLGLGQSETQNPHHSSEPAASAQPGFESAFEEAPGAMTTQKAPEEGLAEADQLNQDVPDWALDEDEEGTMSWLMELDGTEGDGVVGGEDALGFGEGGEQDVLQPNGGNIWLVRAAIAGVSLGLGFAGARYFSQQNAQPPVVPVAQVDTPTNSGTGTRSTQPTNDASPLIQPQGGAQQAQTDQNARRGSRIQLVELGPLPPSAELEGPWRPGPSAFTPVIAEGPSIEVIGEAAEDVATITSGEATATPSTTDAGPIPAPSGEAIAVAEVSAPRPDAGRNGQMRFTSRGRNPYLSVPAPFLTLDGSANSTASQQLSNRGPAIVVSQGTGTQLPTGAKPDDGVTRVVRAPSSTSLGGEDLGGKLREASTAELSGLWTAGSIPMDRIGSEARLMTPSVGRVRVLLTGGEVFEGELYAVGEGKVWIQSDLGKMALLGWQVERIEHLLSTNGVSGSSVNASLDGLPSVRVRTPGGVFYGRLLEQRGESVTLLTEEGARITLQDAEVDTAGRSATHLIDSTNAIEEEQPEPQLQ